MATSTGDEAIRIETGDGIITVTGEIDAGSAPALASTIRATNGSIDLDLAAVTFIDSSALRVLIEAHQIVAARGDELAIVNPSPVARRLFDLSAVTDYLNIR